MFKTFFFKFTVMYTYPGITPWILKKPMQKRGMMFKFLSIMDELILPNVYVKHLIP